MVLSTFMSGLNEEGRTGPALVDPLYLLESFQIDRP